MGSDRSANWATTTVHHNFVIPNLCSYSQNKFYNIISSKISVIPSLQKLLDLFPDWSLSSRKIWKGKAASPKASSTLSRARCPVRHIRFRHNLPKWQTSLHRRLNLRRRVNRPALKVRSRKFIENRVAPISCAKIWRKSRLCAIASVPKWNVSVWRHNQRDQMLKLKVAKKSKSCPKIILISFLGDFQNSFKSHWIFGLLYKAKTCPIWSHWS